MDILKVDNFSLAFKREKSWHTVLHNVTFALKKGETLGIVGNQAPEIGYGSLIMKLLSATQSRERREYPVFDTESSRNFNTPIKKKS